MPVETLTMRVEDVAKTLGVSRNAAYVAVRNGEIPSIRIGRRLVVPKAAVERMLEGAGQEPRKPEAA
jgi:excisionase family DNA binding protein